MGSCSSSAVLHYILAPRESALAQNPETIPLASDEAHASTSEMSERTQKTDFNDIFQVNNEFMKKVKEKYDNYDDLQKRYIDLNESHKQIMEENQSLRQRISNDSEMNHRSYQTSSEDVTSRNKRSDVLKKYQAMDGNKRKQAIEAFGEHRGDRNVLWFRKDLTCRIFVTAYDIARRAKDTFNQKALPNFFQCAPSVGVNFEENGAISSEGLQLSERGMQQSVTPEMQSLLSSESFNVAFSSVLKEMAVNCDLTDLEKQMLRELQIKRDQWIRSEPWLPDLDDEILSKMKNYITDCVRIAWRMVNLLPPLKIKLTDQVRGEELNYFFETEKEEAKESTPTITVCVWPALIEHDGDEVLVKGRAAIIPTPRPKRQHVQVYHV